MTDPDTITYQFLTRPGTTLYGLVATRVDYAVTPAGFQNAEARVVFRPEDGDDRVWTPVMERSYLIECYGGTNDGWASAKAVWEALRDAWHDAANVEVAAGVLLRGMTEQPAVPLVHPKTKQELMVCRMAGRYRGA